MTNERMIHGSVSKCNLNLSNGDVGFSLISLKNTSIRALKELGKPTYGSTTSQLESVRHNSAQGSFPINITTKLHLSCKLKVLPGDATHTSPQDVVSRFFRDLKGQERQRGDGVAGSVTGLVGPHLEAPEDLSFITSPR